MSNPFKSTHQFVGRSEECEAMIGDKPCGRPANHIRHRLVINETNHPNTCMTQLKDGSLCARPQNHEGYCRPFAFQKTTNETFFKERSADPRLSNEIKNCDSIVQDDCVSPPRVGRSDPGELLPTDPFLRQVDHVANTTLGAQAAKKLDEVTPLAGPQEEKKSDWTFALIKRPSRCPFEIERDNRMYRCELGMNHNGFHRGHFETPKGEFNYHSWMAANCEKKIGGLNCYLEYSHEGDCCASVPFPVVCDQTVSLSSRKVTIRHLSEEIIEKLNEKQPDRGRCTHQLVVGCSSASLRCQKKMNHVDPHYHESAMPGLEQNNDRSDILNIAFRNEGSTAFFPEANAFPKEPVYRQLSVRLSRVQRLVKRAIYNFRYRSPITQTGRYVIMGRDIFALCLVDNEEIPEMFTWRFTVEDYQVIVLGWAQGITVLPEL